MRMRQLREAQRPARPPPQAPAPAPVWVKDSATATLPTLLVCALFMTMILPPNLNYGALVTPEDSLAESNIPNRIVMLLVIFSGCFYIARRPQLWLAELRSLNVFYPLFLALAAISMTWSIDQDATLRNVIRLGVVFLCFTTSTLIGWRQDEFQRTMRLLFGVIVVGSLLFALAVPHYGIQAFSDYQPAGAGRFGTLGSAATLTVKPVLRGLTFGKNQMGQLASLAVVFWFHAWLGKDVKTRWVLLCGSAAVICLYWTHSTTSILAAGFSLPILLMLRHWPKWLRKFMPYILVTFTMLILGYSLVVLRVIPQLDFLLTPITALTGKDLTFSNRTAIWDIIISHIVRHPLIGTGYAAYWVDDPNSVSMEFQNLLAFWPGESHNGYLDVVNDLGLLGGLCLLGYLFSYLRQAIKILAFDRHQGSLFVVLLFHQFWSCLSESHWFQASSVSFTVITYAVCCSARILVQHRFNLASSQPRARAVAVPGFT